VTAAPDAVTEAPDALTATAADALSEPAPGDEGGPVVTFVTRSGCHLCEVAFAEVLRARERRPFVLRVLDVDSDPELRAEFGDQVPVVLLDGELFCYYEVNGQELLGAIAARDLH
jgi:Glutaredoxin-like domain (DUF836)